MGKQGLRARVIRALFAKSSSWPELEYIFSFFKSSGGWVKIRVKLLHCAHKTCVNKVPFFCITTSHGAKASHRRCT